MVPREGGGGGGGGGRVPSPNKMFLVFPLSLKDIFSILAFHGFTFPKISETQLLFPFTQICFLFVPMGPFPKKPDNLSGP